MILSTFINPSLLKAFPIRQYPISTLVFMRLLAIPVIEELAYRLPLSGKRNHLRIAIGAFILNQLLVIDYLFFGFANLESYIILSLGLLICYLLVGNGQKVFKRGRNLILISTFVFTCGHAPKLYTDYNNLMVTLVMVLPLIISGFLFCFARLRYGIWFSIVIHSLYNFLTSRDLIIILMTKAH